MTAESPSSASLLLESLLRRGWMETARAALEERRFDRVRGTETHGRVAVAELFPRGGRSAAAASEYQPVPAPLFRAAIGHVPQAARERAFVDLGCGKGRALLLAAEAGYRALRGVELSAPLAATASENLAKTALRLGHPLDVSIRSADATTRRFERDEDTVFLFHPFGARQVRVVARALVESLDAHPRTIWIVYVNPVHGAVFGESSRIRELAVGRTRIPGTLDWVVFEAGG